MQGASEHSVSDSRISKALVYALSTAAGSFRREQSTYNLQLVPFVPIGPDSEGLSATKFDSLIEPSFGECVAQNCKIVVRHFELLVCGIQGMQ